MIWTTLKDNCSKYVNIKCVVTNKGEFVGGGANDLIQIYIFHSPIFLHPAFFVSVCVLNQREKTFDLVIIAAEGQSWCVSLKLAVRGIHTMGNPQDFHRNPVSPYKSFSTCVRNTICRWLQTSCHVPPIKTPRQNPILPKTEHANLICAAISCNFADAERLQVRASWSLQTNWCVVGHMTNREKSRKAWEKLADCWTVAGNWSFQRKIHTGVRGKCNPDNKRPQTQKLPLMLSALFHASDSLAWVLSSKTSDLFHLFSSKGPKWNPVEWSQLLFFG